MRKLNQKALNESSRLSEVPQSSSVLVLATISSSLCRAGGLLQDCGGPDAPLGVFGCPE